MDIVQYIIHTYTWTRMTMTMAAYDDDDGGSDGHKKKYTRRAYKATKMEMATTRTTPHRVNEKKIPIGSLIDWH